MNSTALRKDGRPDGRAFNGRKPGTAVGQATARERFYAVRADRAEFDLAIKRAQYVEVKAIEAARIAEVVRVKDVLQGIPSRLRTRHPDLTAAVLVTLDSMIHEALTELAGPLP